MSISTVRCINTFACITIQHTSLWSIANSYLYLWFHLNLSKSMSIFNEKSPERDLKTASQIQNVRYFKPIYLVSQRSWTCNPCQNCSRNPHCLVHWEFHLHQFFIHKITTVLTFVWVKHCSKCFSSTLLFKYRKNWINFVNVSSVPNHCYCCLA